MPCESVGEGCRSCPMQLLVQIDSSEAAADVSDTSLPSHLPMLFSHCSCIISRLGFLSPPTAPETPPAAHTSPLIAPMSSPAAYLPPPIDILLPLTHPLPHPSVTLPPHCAPPSHLPLLVCYPTDLPFRLLWQRHGHALLQEFGGFLCGWNFS